jgi:hypothetical protein
MTKKCPPMKILITPTQSEKFDRCKHMEDMPIRMYVRKDRNGAGGFEVAGSIKNPMYDPEAAVLEGEGVTKNLKKLKKVAKVAGKVAGFVAPAVALVAPPVGLGLGVASAATRAVLGDGEVPPPPSVVDEMPPKKKRAKKQHATEMPRYTIAKKKPQ